MATNVRIQPRTYEQLREMAEQCGATLPEMLSVAIDQHYRKWMLEGLAEDYGRMRSDPRAWAQEQRDRKVWDRTLADGLEDL